MLEHCATLRSGVVAVPGLGAGDDHLAGVDISEDDGSGTDDRPVPDGHPVTDDGSGTYEHLCTDVCSASDHTPLSAS